MIFRNSADCPLTPKVGIAAHPAVEVVVAVGKALVIFRQEPLQSRVTVAIAVVVQIVGIAERAGGSARCAKVFIERPIVVAVRDGHVICGCKDGTQVIGMEIAARSGKIPGHRRMDLWTESTGGGCGVAHDELCAKGVAVVNKTLHHAIFGFKSHSLSTGFAAPQLFS